MDRLYSNPALLVQVPPVVCALPLSQVLETMRPLPIEPLSNMPEFVRGVAVVRGIPVPVIDLAILLRASGQGVPKRLVTIRTGGRVVALLVESVLGVTQLMAGQLDDMPPLLQNDGNVIEAIASLDTSLLVALQSARLVPEFVWKAMGQREVAW